MSGTQWVGVLMLVALFTFGFVYLGKTSGWRLTAEAFGITALLMAFIFAAAYLLSGGAW